MELIKLLYAERFTSVIKSECLRLYETDATAAIEVQCVMERSRKYPSSGPRNDTGMSLALLAPEINCVMLVCFY